MSFSSSSCSRLSAELLSIETCQKFDYLLSIRTHQYHGFVYLRWGLVTFIHTTRSVRSSSLLTIPTQLSQNLGQADEALGLAEYAGFTFFLMWVYNLQDVTAWLMKSFGVVTDGILIPKQGFIDPLGQRAFPRHCEGCLCTDLFCF